MAHVADVANRMSIGSGGEHSRASGMNDEQRQPDRVVQRLFARMQAIYAHRWSSQFPEDADGYAVMVREWAVQLAGLDYDEIRNGLDRLHQRSSNRYWPPTPIEFRELCRPHRQPYERPEFQQRALPQPADPEVGRSFLSSIRQQLGMPNQRAGRSE